MALFFWRSDQSRKSLMRLMLAVVQGIPIVFSKGDGHKVESHRRRGGERGWDVIESKAWECFLLTPCGKILLATDFLKHLSTNIFPPNIVGEEFFHSLEFLTGCLMGAAGLDSFSYTIIQDQVGYSLHGHNISPRLSPCLPSKHFRTHVEQWKSARHHNCFTVVVFP